MAVRERRVPARRIPVPESGDANDVIFSLEEGDYCGPFEGYTADKPAVFFCLPEAELPDRGVRHVTSPPHQFRECPDGSLEIRESILAVRGDGGNGWHGYLDEGNQWRIL